MLTSAGAQAGGPGAIDKSANGVVDEYLVIRADGGSIVQDGDTLRLKLDGVDPNVAVLNGSPNELAGSMSVSEFFRSWETLGLADSPANAAISVIFGKGTGKASTYTLTNPRREGKSITFRATPQNLSANPAVASAIQDHVASATGPVPHTFGESTLFIDPEPNGLIQYCQANISNKTGAVVVVGVVTAFLKTNSTVVIPIGGSTTVKTLAPVACAIAIAFTTGARRWDISMAAVTGRRNGLRASSNVTVVPGDYNSAHWTVNFALH